MACKIVDRYNSLQIPCLWLDGDRVRQGLSNDLGYTLTDRIENHRRIIEVAGIAYEQGFNVVVSAMAPTETIRAKVNELAKIEIVWIYIDTDDKTCSQRGNGTYSADQNCRSIPFCGPTPTEKIKLQLNTSLESVEMSQSRVFSELNLINP